ncbi:MAG TPA: glycosyltransferase family 2 protein [Saprospiraceae bacterium]|nr:glycosyltransferase family 2 protein [Saprospiraceae bacterium]HMP25456.1 glycosyltransferase family 2 protein [Saprospiraceae bacterium]
MDISVVIPLYNEEESLPELEAWIRRVMEEHRFRYEIIFVDDGSKDGSWEIIEALSRQHASVRGIKFRRNYGKSAALNVGFQAAQGRVVITMDADLQDSPEEVPDLYRMVVEDGFDMVSGWKKKRYDPVLTKNLPSKFFNWTARRMSGIMLHDFNCGLKAYKNSVVKSIEVYGDMHRYIPVLAKWAGFKKIGEKVVQHQERKYGVTKFGVERFIRGPLDLLTVIFISKFGKRPMHLFGMLGVLFFIAGFVILTYLSIAKLMYEKYGITERPLFFLGMLTLIIGTQLFLTGFLAELITRNATDRNVYLIEKETDRH